MNEGEFSPRDGEPFIIIKEGDDCSVLPVFDVTRDKLQFQVGRISYASRQDAEKDAKGLCPDPREEDLITGSIIPLPPRKQQP